MQPSISPRSDTSFSELYKEHNGWLKGWLLKKLRCYQSAEDTAQDTFHKLLLAPPSELANLKSPRPYLSTIAKRLMIDQLRRRKVEALYLEALNNFTEHDAYSSVQDHHQVIETLILLANMLDKLPEKPRKAFLACRFEGLSYKEIADELDVSASMVKQYIAQVMVECYAIVFENEKTK